jgi:SWI/SNF-related matrix-associated actin-dependent regulator of chromatin subfamily A member 5
MKILSVFQKNVRDLHTSYKILLTGTPLQNNLHELWSLLNYLLPDIFESSEVFDAWFEAGSRKGEESAEENEERQVEMIRQLHKIIKPFMLR